MFLYRLASIDDMNQIAAVHVKCFPNYFITSIGAKLLSNYYAEYCKESNIFVVVEDDRTNKIVGFCMGYIKGETNARTLFIKNNRIKLIFRFALNILKFDFRIFKKIFFKNKKSKKVTSDHSKIGDLLSICVIEEYRGIGISNALLQYFEKTLQEKNISQYSLTVRKSNIVAQRFYEKSGMAVVDETIEDFIYFKKIVNPII